MAPDTLSPADLDRLLELAGKATKGPWDLCWASPSQRLPALVTFDDDKKMESHVIAELSLGSAKQQDANAAYIAALDPPTATRLIEMVRGLTKHAKAMSDALIKVRPLGGSELFVQVGEAYYADPAYCGAEIVRMREKCHDALIRATSAERRAEALEAALKPFAAIADDREFQPHVADDTFPVNLGLMNGNVTQSVIRDKLKVRDFWAARAALSEEKTND